MFSQSLGRGFRLSMPGPGLGFRVCGLRVSGLEGFRV